MSIWREFLKPFESAMLVYMQLQMPVLCENYLKRQLDEKRYFTLENTEVIADGEFANRCV